MGAMGVKKVFRFIGRARWMQEVLGVMERGMVRVVMRSQRLW